MKIYGIICIIVALTYLITGFRIRKGKLVVNEKRNAILHLATRNWTIGAVVGFLLLSPVYIMEWHYESDDYLEERKIEVLENYENGNVEICTSSSGKFYNKFIPNDTSYYDEVTISNIEKNTPPRIIFWKDRDKNNEWWNIKSDILIDFGFYLNPEDPLDIKIYNYMLDDECVFIQKEMEEMEIELERQMEIDSLENILKERELYYLSQLDSMNNLPEIVKIQNEIEFLTEDHQKEIFELEKRKKEILDNQ
ncbi:MAG: hypothetical protein SLAVMIC_00440 [uncultured marine phage]|uniref:Uncharacterized protein n=1 Tax=uncultured marine phage TaxID=707152 RepID=A0A8D9CA14_9VIRU|nr:MAG: hypothetical protein SLAVMIC_00440 [uncultured marine phage]